MIFSLKTQIESQIMLLVFQFLILGKELKSEFWKYILIQYSKFVLGSPFDFCENTENVCLENSWTYVYIVLFVLCFVSSRGRQHVTLLQELCTFITIIINNVCPPDMLFLKDNLIPKSFNQKPMQWPKVNIF